MNIGIYTLPLHTNFGGILQAYALQTTLEQLGHEAIIIDRPPYPILDKDRKSFIYAKRFIKKYLFRQNIEIFKEKKFYKTYPIISQNTQKFIDKYIHRIIINNLRDLNPNSFDAIIVGSDQIWRAVYNSKIENSYLLFAKDWDIKRIAYAASFGTDKWEYSPQQTILCASLLQKFNAVSVRETSAIKLCKKYFNVQAVSVLDPTMLLDKNDYIQLINHAETKPSQGNLLNYILDETPEIKEFINKIAQQRGLTPFRINGKAEDKNAPLIERIQPSVEQWLRGFYEAELIITDSFHACVFSIIFNKPFIVYGNKERGLARFESLLNLFSLQENLITDLSQDHALKIKAGSILSQEKLKEEKKRSLEYLIRTLK
ncbi:polysaccharide pyruvyl transferase family protein [Bacteroides gallinaceum]|uniref:Polysaccharide pyruvyl transferase family protein n=1 Tax=Bacteroides gallinaceum TaxID=1462571 RepID=A0ABT7VIK0_9BACE|nr:polysaccharide pyruvyl transferase family protein [Bacteroides gallinaceum]MDM8326135.1 polysaccharide pyruvyl transferase family protein [Bacteroides gallinaceum]